ncbi:MaoC family dehydratase [Laribacter hongkongensis]|uniref:MaoC family dehydratase n=1 Tax=Laribacter hongkongensis TaxID=168471 RepID=UPI001EFD0E50|nr:MaoC family dehydratase [Laribacter hongkongensis]MCG9095920.1 MaoC family dehydratase [Laribacter hongkongensis]
MSVYLEDLQPGMSADYGKTITEADILLFSAVSGDNNPVHLNAEYAENTLFKTRIAHGMLTASFISTILGTRLPGEGTIFLSNSCKFKAPVRIGDTVTARCTVSVIDVEKKRATFKTECWVKDTLVLEGEAVVMPPRRS